MKIDLSNPFIRFFLNQIQHYNHNAYWRMRNHVIDPNSKLPKILRLYYLYKIKKMDAFNHSSMGTDFGQGAYFASPPNLVHGLNNIFVSHYATIGHHCSIMRGVTIAQQSKDNNISATIGDNCSIGTNAVIIGGVKIGNNVKIGANAVILTDIPDNCTAVGVPARIIRR
ncbi:MAG: serine O-acetyltransferase [Ignavibacteriales bacterium]